MNTIHYAGFWKRFIAALIDFLILYIIYFIIITPFLSLLGLSILNNSYSTGITTGLIGVGVLTYFSLIIVSWLYYILLESGPRQSTFGKRAMGIKVTDLNGNRISIGQATGRYFGKILSALILYVGFFMAGFTEKKQSLHDIMASCLVVDND
jgi:uncharacterized RDD family membrane protein YckC